jgi:hypothetical protein
MQEESKKKSGRRKDDRRMDFMGGFYQKEIRAGTHALAASARVVPVG